MSDIVSDIKRTALIIYAHPDRKGLNGALMDVTKKELTRKGYDILLSDLYAQYVEPSFSKYDKLGKIPGYMSYPKAYQKISFDFKREMEKIMQADLVTFLFHLQYNTIPDVLRGWLDTMLFSGTTFKNTWDVIENGPMKGKRAVMSLTTNDAVSSVEDMNVVLWSVQYSVLRMSGFDVLRPQCCCLPAQSDDSTQKSIIEDWKNRLLHLNSEEPNTCLGFPDLKQFKQIIKQDRLKEIKRKRQMERSFACYMDKLSVK